MGARAGLRDLDVLSAEDLSRYQSALEAGGQKGWHYYFPYLLTRHRPNRRAVYYTVDDGSFCVFQWRGAEGQERLDVLLAPAPMQPAVLRRCIERANDFNRDRSARVLHIDEADADATADAGLRVRPRKQQFLFAPAHYADLRGKALYTVRRQVERTVRIGGVEVRPYETSDAAACRELLDRWHEMHRRIHKTQGGAGASRRLIDLTAHLPKGILGGQVVEIEGRLAAFTLGGRMRDGLACSIERKCDAGVPGLSYFQLQRFLLSLEGFELVNDGSDAGRAGLQQLKSSFRPVAMHTEFRARQPA